MVPNRSKSGGSYGRALLAAGVDVVVTLHFFFFLIFSLFCFLAPLLAAFPVFLTALELLDPLLFEVTLCFVASF